MCSGSDSDLVLYAPLNTVAQNGSGSCRLKINHRGKESVELVSWLPSSYCSTATILPYVLLHNAIIVEKTGALKSRIKWGFNLHHHSKPIGGAFNQLNHLLLSSILPKWFSACLQPGQSLATRVIQIANDLIVIRKSLIFGMCPQSYSW
jgi:hypothetical protein